MTIGEASRASGVPARTIRFYEAAGVLPPPPRTSAGHRVYSTADVRRLRLAGRARLLGVPLAEVRDLVWRAFAADCDEFAADLLDRLAERRRDVKRRIAELRALRAELVGLERHVRHVREREAPGSRVASCGYCPLIDEEGGAPDGG